LLPRQQTLRALVDWSHDLLQDDEQLLLARSSVFAGGFDLAAAEAVCGADPLTPEGVVDLLTSLVDKSLVSSSTSEHGTRYGMLETIRDYARIKLIERGELRESCSRHCDHYFVMAKAARHGVLGPAQSEWLQRLESEHDNLRAAMAHSLSPDGDPFIGAKIEVALQAFRMMRGYATEGRDNVRVLLSLPAIRQSDIANAHVLYVGGVLAYELGETEEAERMLEACLVLRRRIGDPAAIPPPMSTLAAVRLRRGDSLRAREGELEALAMFRELGDSIGEAIALLHLAEIGVHRGDEAEMLPYVSQSLALAQQIGHQEVESDCEKVLGELALQRSDLDAARQHFQRALEICEAARDRRGAAVALWRLGHLDIALGQALRARQRLDEALLTLRAFRMGPDTIGCLEDQALLAHSTGSAERAVRLCAAASAARTRMSLPRPPRAEARWATGLTELRARLGDASFDANWDEGRQWGLDDAIRMATAPAERATADT